MKDEQLVVGIPQKPAPGVVVLGPDMATWGEVRRAEIVAEQRKIRGELSRDVDVLPAGENGRFKHVALGP